MIVIVVWLLLILAILILQATIIPLLDIQGVRPDILLILVVSCGLLSGKEYGVGIGFFSGLLQDLASGNIFGLNILSKMATGYLFGMAERKVFKENILLPVLGVFAATIVNNLLMILLLFILRLKVDITNVLFRNMLLAAGYNLVLAIPVHRLVFRVSRFLARRD
ncbi:cell shape-determining protein mred [Lucifera butyrica]|uniref:Cell shape-determining protein mred n=1 Tax=Lucifera butyrica TaxID=1351585 RepID=A0A498R8M4_9FIRM|nr:rod shape-determining protein MreD [Lucifera butyrica]VBB07864.1 cell shape-determining protein mred [Lucifera butyrica]